MTAMEPAMLVGLDTPRSAQPHAAFERGWIEGYVQGTHWGVFCGALCGTVGTGVAIALWGTVKPWLQASGWL